MNKTLLTLAIVLVFPLTAAAFPGGGQGRDGFHGRRMERLAQDLNLTADQKTKVEALFKEQHEKMKAIHDETKTKLGTILTPEQMTKLEQIKKQRKEKWRNRQSMEKAPVKQ